MKTTTIEEILTDQRLLGHAKLDGETWKPWHSIWKATLGEPLSDEELAVFKELTGREKPPEKTKELWAICGRRSGKSQTAALLAVVLSFFRDYRPFLSAGERGTSW